MVSEGHGKVEWFFSFSRYLDRLSGLPFKCSSGISTLLITLPLWSLVHPKQSRALAWLWLGWTTAWQTDPYTLWLHNLASCHKMWHAGLKEENHMSATDSFHWISPKLPDWKAVGLNLEFPSLWWTVNQDFWAPPTNGCSLMSYPGHPRPPWLINIMRAFDLIKKLWKNPFANGLNIKIEEITDF